jgi:K+-sensing histidine kinase KdpD
VEIGKQILMTRGNLTTFSIANDIAKYFAIIPAALVSIYPQLGILNLMHLASPQSAILSAVIFNAVIIPMLIRQIFSGELAIFLPTAEEKLEVKAKTPGFEVNPKIMGVATWVLLKKQPAGRFTGTIPEARSSYFPMITADKVLGVLAINFAGSEKTLPPENQVVIDTFAHLGAMALERIRFNQ